MGAVIYIGTAAESASATGSLEQREKVAQAPRTFAVPLAASPSDIGRHAAIPPVS